MVYKRTPTSTYSCGWSRSDGSGASSAHLLVDEAVDFSDDDATYLEATSSTQATFIMGTPVLSNHTTFKIRFRAKGSDNTNCKVGFDFEDPMVSVAFRASVFLVTNAWATYEITVSPNSRDPYPIDFTNNHLRMGAVLTNSATVRVSAVELEFQDPVNINITRQALDVLGEAPSTPQLRITRQAIDVLAKYVPPSVPLHFTRQAIDVLGKALPALMFTRQVMDVLAEAPPPNLFVTRQAIDMLGLNVYDVVVFPQPLPNPLPSIFLHNWKTSTRLRCAYSTDVVRAQSVAEDRRSLLERPFRTVNVNFTGMRRNEAAKLMMLIYRFSNSRLLMPLFCDKAKVTATASGTSIPVNTTLSRFFRGGRIVIHWFDKTNRPINVEYGIIASLTTSEITLTSSLINSFPAGSRVYPVIDTEVALSSSGVHVSDEVFDIELAVNEIPGKSALYVLPAPDGLTTFNGHPVFTPRIDWSSDKITDVERVGEEVQNGRSVIVTIQGDRPQFNSELNFTCKTRTDAWWIIRFFDYIRGRGRSWYLAAPETYFKVTGVTATSLTVEASSSAADVQAFIKTVAIIMKNGTMYLRDITSVVDGGTTYTLNFLTLGLVPVLADIRRATSAHLVRLDNDANIEDWVTDEHCRMRFKALELLEEKDVVLGSLEESFEFISGPEEIDDLFFWADASFNTWLWDATPPGNHNQPATSFGDLVYNWDDFRGQQSAFLRANAPLTFAFTGGKMVYFTDSNVNKGRRTIQSWSVVNPGYWFINSNPEAYLTEFVNNSLGLTLVYNIRTSLDGFDPGFPVPKTEYLRQTGVLEWLGDNIKIFTTVDVVNTNLWIQNLPDFRTGELMTLILRWVPGEAFKLYKNGALVGQSTNTVASLPTGTGREINMLSLQKSFADQELGDDAYQDSNWINTIGLYKRALTNSELNQLGNFLQARYGSPWANIP